MLQCVRNGPAFKDLCQWRLTIAYRSSSFLLWLRMAVCFSVEWCQGGRRLRGTSHFDRSISMTMGTTCAGRDRTDVEKISIDSLQRLLSCSWSHCEPETMIIAMISSGVSGFTLSGRILNGSVFQSITFVNEGRLINRCEVCKRIGMGSPTMILRDIKHPPKKWPTPTFLTNAFFKTFLRCFHCEKIPKISLPSILIMIKQNYLFIHKSRPIWMKNARHMIRNEHFASRLDETYEWS